MTTGLILVRHGETVDNVNGIAQGWSDSPLTRKGLEQVTRLAGRLQRVGPTSLWSSTLPRALRTAEVIGEALELPIQELEDLREMNCGRWEGVPFHKVREKDRDLYERWRSDPSVACPGGESFNDVTERMRRAVDQIASSDPAAPVIVTHGTAIRLITCALLGLPAEAAYRMRQYNAAINILERRSSDYFLTTWNDSSHCFVEEGA